MTKHIRLLRSWNSSEDNHRTSRGEIPLLKQKKGSIIMKTEVLLKELQRTLNEVKLAETYSRTKYDEVVTRIDIGEMLEVVIRAV